MISRRYLLGNVPEIDHREVAFPRLGNVEPLSKADIWQSMDEQMEAFIEDKIARRELGWPSKTIPVSTAVMEQAKLRADHAFKEAMKWPAFYTPSSTFFIIGGGYES